MAKEILDGMQTKNNIYFVYVTGIQCSNVNICFISYIRKRVRCIYYCFTVISLMRNIGITCCLVVL